MKLASRHEHLTRALADWQARGLLPPDIADRLRADLGPRTDLNFTQFALLGGAVCLGLGAISFVAANWDSITPGGRLMMVMGALWLAWGGVAAAALRGWTLRFEALALLATLLFGAAMALVSQIFQIQGELDDLMFLWAAGGLAGALIVRSKAALALAIALILTWDITGWDITGWNRSGLDARDAWVLGGLVLAGVGALALQARWAGHLVLAGLFVWAGATVLRTDAQPEAVVLALTFLHALIALALASASGRNILHRYEISLLTQGLLALWLGLILLFLSDYRWDQSLIPALPWALPGVALAALALWLGRDSVARYDLGVALGAALLVALVTSQPVGPWPRAALALALTIWVVRMGVRQDLAGLRRLGMAGFAVTLLTIYLQTVGSLLGTAGFYAGAGVLLIGAAWGWRRWGRG